MPHPKTCPKCSGTMTQGRIMKLNSYSTKKEYEYLFAPDNEVMPDLSSMLSGKSSSSRKALVAFACNECGFTEFYSQAAG